MSRAQIRTPSHLCERISRGKVQESSVAGSGHRSHNRSRILSYFVRQREAIADSTRTAARAAFARSLRAVFHWGYRLQRLD